MIFTCNTYNDVELLVTELLNTNEGLFWVDDLEVCLKEELSSEALTKILQNFSVKLLNH